MAGYGIKEQSNQGGLLQFTGNEELDRRDREEAQKKAEQTAHRPEISSLAGHIRLAFTNAVDSKQEVQDEMLRSLRQRNGVYEADVMQGIIDQGGTKIYMMITDVLCRAFESYMKDIMLGVGEPPFELEATPIPDIQPEVAKAAWEGLKKQLETEIMQQTGGVLPPGGIPQEMLMQEGEKLEKELLKQMKEIADEAAEELNTEINDEFKEGGWYTALSDFIDDLSTYPTAFIVGPVYRKEKVFEWTPVPGSPLSQMTVVEKITRKYDRFDPFDVYPASAARNIQKGELCLRLRLQRTDIDAMKGVPGYHDATIDHILALYGKSGFRDFVYSDTEYADLQDRPRETQDVTGWIDAIKYFGNVQGLLLRQWGMTPEQVPDPFKDYAIEAIVVGNYVIMARLNPHPLGKRGIYSASYKKKNGTIWGQAPPYLMRDIQSACNAAARALCNNFAIASGPQVWINMERIAPGTDIRQIQPWTIWPFLNPKTGASGSTDKPMDFFQPELITDQLLKFYDYFFKQAREITGIPAYTSENLRGAGKTARGLAMLRNDAARGIRAVARNVDMGFISSSVEEHWISIILENPERARGDVKVVARASEYLVQQEQLEMRRNAMLESTNNPTDLQIMGLAGRAELLKANAQTLKIPVDKIILEKEEMIMNIVNEQIQQIVMALSQALEIPPDQIMAILQKPQGGGQKQITAPKKPDGDKAERTLPE